VVVIKILQMEVMQWKNLEKEQHLKYVGLRAGPAMTVVGARIA